MPCAFFFFFHVGIKQTFNHNENNENMFGIFLP